MPEAYIRKDRFIFTILLFLIVALAIKAAMMFVSFVHFDTNYYLNIGSNFVLRGELTPYMWRLGSDTNIIAGSGTGYGVLVLTYWLKVFGVSLYSGYVLMYLVGVLNLIVIFFLAKLWWRSDVAAWLSMLALAITGRFLTMFYVRMDALGILSYSILLLIHIYALRSNKMYLHFFVGILSILTTEFHILGTLYVLGLAIYYLYLYIQDVRETKQFFTVIASVYFYAGAFIAGIIYLIIHVLPDPQAYFIITAECPICDPPSFFKELIRIIRYLSNDPIEVLVLGIALGATFSRRSEDDIHLLILLFGCWLGLIVISPPTYGFYTMHLIPIFSLFIGGMFANETGQLSRRIFIVVCSAIFCMLLYQFYQLSIYSATPKPRPDGVTYVLNYVPEDSVVMGKPTIYHYLLNYDNFLSYRDGDLYGISLRNEDITTFWERERPTVIVGEIEDDDLEWWAYMRNNDFVRVWDEVWIEGTLYQQLISDVQIPSITLDASEMAIAFGDCTTLEWQVLDADIVTFDNDFTSDDNDDVLENRRVPSVNTTSVCPFITNTYTISAYWVGGIEQTSIEIIVE